mmetsp:Transcript_23942/g.60630  ORF Transcript_23942/g.60630 Transcript_23942/m.60630 type:complete len:82 (-) Transcript_23942:4376-4621(-)
MHPPEERHGIARLAFSCTLFYSTLSTGEKKEERKKKEEKKKKKKKKTMKEPREPSLCTCFLVNKQEPFSFCKPVFSGGDEA